MLPLLQSENYWCATVEECEEPVAPEEDEAPLVIGDGAGARSHLVGSSIRPDWSPKGKAGGPREDLESRLRALPRDPVDALPAALREALTEIGGLEGAEVVGLLDVGYFRGGLPWITNRFDFTALVREGGLHVRERTFVPDEDGRVMPHEESLMHDGRMLLVETTGEASGLAYLPGYYDLPVVLRARLAPYSLLETWFENPLCVQRLVGASYESLADGRGQPIVIETYPGIRGPGADGSTIYRFGGDDVLPRVESIEYRAGDGGIRIRREFSAWSEVAGGALRPSQITEIRFGPDGAPELQRTLRVHTARPMSLERSIENGWLTPRAEEWLVFR